IAVLAIAGFYIVANIAIGNARDGLRIIGHDAGPQVLATGDLFFALSDMDSQVANVLLTGREHDLGTRQQALNRYSQERATADRPASKGGGLSPRHPHGQGNVRSGFDGPGAYGEVAPRAMVLNGQANPPAGPAAGHVIAVFRQGTGLMKVELVPQGYNLPPE